MKFRIGELFRWDGTVSRLTYFLVGVLGLGLKFSLDHFVAQTIFHRGWWLFYYWSPLGYATSLLEVSKRPDDAAFLVTMVVLAFPFIWVGTVMTLRRLRDAGWPAWLVVFFFFPYVNLLFFAMLIVTPPRPMQQQLSAGSTETNQLLDRLIPRSKWGSALMAWGFAGAFGVVCAVFAIGGLESYGWGLFVALPFSLGLTSALVHGYHEPRSLGTCLMVSAVPLLLVAAVLLIVAMEGFICVLMAAPIELVFSLLGGFFGYLIQKRSWAAREAASLLGALLLGLPGVMSFEAAQHEPPPLYAVRTAIEINAPPERVWRQLIAFSEITEPPELIFRMGIAWPVRAEMHGSGAGAVRHCVFSTGAFVEPITVWDEPRLLRFAVTQNPPPMRELTPYSEISPPHLNGYLVSRQGQFRLEALPGGRTRLEGTTWYHHGLWPAEYWKVWSDFLIHRIHLRVLRHIRRLSEEKPL